MFVSARDLTSRELFIALRLAPICMSLGAVGGSRKHCKHCKPAGALTSSRYLGLRCAGCICIDKFESSRSAQARGARLRPSELIERRLAKISDVQPVLHSSELVGGVRSFVRSFVRATTVDAGDRQHKPVHVFHDISRVFACAANLTCWLVAPLALRNANKSRKAASQKLLNASSSFES